MENIGIDPVSRRRMSKSELAVRLNALRTFTGSNGPNDSHEVELKTVLHELEVYQIELEMQVRELSESRAELEESHNRYANLYDFAPVGYVTLNEHGIIQEVNLTAAGMFGVERQWLIERSFAPWVIGPDQPVFRTHMKRCRDEGGSITSTLQIQNRVKQVIAVELSTICFADPSTGNVQFRTTITDLSERRKAETELNLFFNISTDFLCLVSMDGRFTRVNPACEKILGYTSSELLNRVCLDFIHPDDRESSIVILKHLGREGGAIEDYQNRYIKNGGSVVHLSWNVMTFEGTFYCIARDVTEQVKAKEESLRRRQQLEKVESFLRETVAKLESERVLREQFVSTLTHDLRTPLSSAKMSAELLARQPDDPNRIQMLAGLIIKGVVRIDHMIQDLLDANLIRAGEKLQLKFTEFNLTFLVRNTLDDLTVVHGKRFIFKSTTQLRGRWNKHQLRRVIENLTNNAVKYGDPDKPITVSLTAPTKDTVLMTVQNFGTPISKDEQLNLFEQYRRSSDPEKNRKKGWGLGLTLVKGIVEAHQGEIQVTSDAAGGTVFSVTLSRKL